MTEDEWKQYAAQTLKAELVKAGVSYENLIQRLHAQASMKVTKALPRKSTGVLLAFYFSRSV
jgi:hypothetical protein